MHFNINKWASDREETGGLGVVGLAFVQGTFLRRIHLGQLHEFRIPTASSYIYTGNKARDPESAGRRRRARSTKTCLHIRSDQLFVKNKIMF